PPWSRGRGTGKPSLKVGSPFLDRGSRLPRGFPFVPRFNMLPPVCVAPSADGEAGMAMRTTREIQRQCPRRTPPSAPLRLERGARSSIALLLFRFGPTTNARQSFLTTRRDARRVDGGRRCFPRRSSRQQR